MVTKRNNKKKSLQMCLMVVATCIVLAGVCAVLGTNGTVWAAPPDGKGKGNVGGDVSGAIFCKVTFDDVQFSGANALIGDDDPDYGDTYVDGVDRAEIAIGRNRTIQMDFNSHSKKDSIRNLVLAAGFDVSSTTCAPQPQEVDGLIVIDLDNPPSPLPYFDPANNGLIADAKLVIKGEDHDDTPIDCQRYVNAVLEVKDDNGETWFVYYGSRESGGGSTFARCGSCVVVKRLENVDNQDPGISRWEFSTEGHGYVYRDNNPPHNPTEFWGVVDLPFSGAIESLSNEPLPTATCDEFTDSTLCP